MAALYTTSNGTLGDAQDINQLVNLLNGTTTGVALQVQSTMRSTGSTTPVNGVGLESYWNIASGGYGQVIAYDRTNSVYKDLQINQSLRLYASSGVSVGSTPADPGANNLRVQGTLAVVGVTTLGGPLTVSGSGITVTGNSTFNQALTISGTLTTSNITANAAVTITAGGLAVTGNATFANNVTISGTATFGAISLLGAFTTTQLTVNGTSALNGAVTVSSGGIAVTGNSSITGTLTVSSSVTLNNGLTVSSGGITVTGTATFLSTASFAGNVSVSGSLSMNYNAGTVGVIGGGTFDVTGTGQTANATNYVRWYGFNSHLTLNVGGGNQASVSTLLLTYNPVAITSGSLNLTNSGTLVLLSGPAGGYSINDQSGLPWRISPPVATTSVRTNAVVADFFPAGGPTSGTNVQGYLKMNHATQGTIWLPYMQ